MPAKQDPSGGFRVENVMHATQPRDESPNVECGTPPRPSSPFHSRQRPEWEGVTLQDAPYDSDIDSIEDEDLVAARAAVQGSPGPRALTMYEESELFLSSGSPMLLSANRLSMQSNGSSLCITNLDGNENDFKSGAVTETTSATALPKVIIHVDDNDPESVLQFEQESHSMHIPSQPAGPSILDPSPQQPQSYIGFPMPSVPPLSPRARQQDMLASNTSKSPTIVPVSPDHYYPPAPVSALPLSLQMPADGHLSPHTACDDADDTQSTASSSSVASTTSKRHRLSAAFRRMRAASDTSPSSSIFKHGRHRSASQTPSIHVPEDLPALPDEAMVPGLERSDTVIRRAEEAWENRAVALATKEMAAEGGVAQRMGRLSVADSRLARQRSPSVGTPEMEANIQTAIDLHEKGDLVESTRMFGCLADPNGDNNALAQVLYGLALRHGWGIQARPDEAIAYLRMAASNSAVIENEAKKANTILTPRSRRTGAGGAKGELTLAIFELANCFRFGWGVDKDAVAAKQYYETAAHLGDPDAMLEVGWCLLTGSGCKKDKFMAAQFYRMAEKAGKEEVGQSWIWKEKYDPTRENMEKHKRRV
ncbi:hypothetical protein V1522DRAFT_404389 [Lipomyces starkeyi]